MKKEYLFVILVLALLVGTASASQIRVENEQNLSYKIEIVSPMTKEDLTNYVNPFIGTGTYSHLGAMGRANCYPGVVVPFGMVQLSPDTGNNIAGYLYEDSYIQGFSHTHVSGCGRHGFGNILIMPTTGDIKITEGQYKSKFSHDNENASPGYYTVDLERYNIRSELTATNHVGFHKYTFPFSNNAHILIDVSHTLEYTPPKESSVEIVDNETITGYVTIPSPFLTGKTPYTTYFVAKFSKPFSSYGTWNGRTLYPGVSSQSGKDVGAHIDYSTSADEIIKVKVGISYVSVEQACLNLENETPDWDFEKVRCDARADWNDKLNKIEVEGGTNDQKVIFYTALYHSLLMPHTFSDVNGEYIGMDDSIYTAENYTHYATFSLWDTFRSEHPLLTLIQPKKQNDMIKSSVNGNTRKNRINDVKDLLIIFQVSKRKMHLQD